jgi:PAS domain-containing protein
VPPTPHAFDVLWRFLDISARYPDPERRRQAQLLTVLLAGLIPLITVVASLHRLTLPAFATAFDAVLLAVAGLIVALLLNLRGQYTTASVLTIIATAAACYAAILIPPHAPYAYAYLGVNVLLAGLLFGQPGIIVSGTVNVMVLSVLLPPLGMPAPNNYVYAPALFVIVIAALMSLAIRQRDFLETDRRTERKRTQQALLRSEELYRTIVETAQEGIWQIDSENRTTFVNKKMADMLGYSIDEMAQRMLFDFMDDAGKALAAENVERRRAVSGHFNPSSTIHA